MEYFGTEVSLRDTNIETYSTSANRNASPQQNNKTCHSHLCTEYRIVKGKNQAKTWQSLKLHLHKLKGLSHEMDLAFDDMHCRF
jgi:hypothetical protein